MHTLLLDSSGYTHSVDGAVTAIVGRLEGHHGDLSILHLFNEFNLSRKKEAKRHK